MEEQLNLFGDSDIEPKKDMFDFDETLEYVKKRAFDKDVKAAAAKAVTAGSIAMVKGPIVAGITTVATFGWALYQGSDDNKEK